MSSWYRTISGHSPRRGGVKSDPAAAVEALELRPYVLGTAAIEADHPADLPGPSVHLGPAEVGLAFENEVQQKLGESPLVRVGGILLFLLFILLILVGGWLMVGCRLFGGWRLVGGWLPVGSAGIGLIS